MASPVLGMKALTHVAGCEDRHVVSWLFLGVLVGGPIQGFPGFRVFLSRGPSLAQTPKGIQKVDPLEGSIIYAIGVIEFRIGGSTFWDPLRRSGLSWFAMVLEWVEENSESLDSRGAVLYLGLGVLLKSPLAHE